MTISQKIKMALAYKGMSEAELARSIGTSPSAFNQRMKTGKFSTEEMDKIAEVLEAEYFFGFQFKDGTRIETKKRDSPAIMQNCPHRPQGACFGTQNICTRTPAPARSLLRPRVVLICRHRISQADMYQMYAYQKKYTCCLKIRGDFVV